MGEHPHEHTVIDSLYRISSLVSDTDDPRDALEFILREIVAILKPGSASIALLNPDSRRLEIEVSHGLPEGAASRDLALGEGVTGWTALHGRSLIVPDVRKDPRYVPVRAEVRSEMAVPMEDRGVVIGVVNVDSERPDAFDEEALKILTLLTGEAGKVVAKLWLIRQLRAKAHQLETLVNMGQRIVGKLELNEVLVELAREAHQLMNCHICALLLLNPDGRTLRLHTMIGPDGALPYDENLSIEDSSVGAAVHRRKQIEVNDLAFTEEHHFIRIIQREGLASMLATPIIFNDDVIGALNIYTRRPHRFNNDEKKVVATLASLGAVAIQNARLYARIFSSEESLRRNEKLTTLGLLAAEIAHEIRNPLTVIKLLFQSLDLSFNDGDPRQKDVAVIEEKLDQLEEIVERVLGFGRSREGMYARYELHPLVEETLRLVRLKLHQQKIAIDYQPAEESLRIEVNKGQIQQVVLNLILNATQAMPEGGRIAINTGRMEGRAQLTMSDNGSGIPPEIQCTIFESFLTQHSEGTGLGLSISKRILRSHRGDIELVESGPGGTTFRFWLPLA